MVVLTVVRPADDHDDEVVFLEDLLVAHRRLQEAPVLVDPLLEIQRLRSHDVPPGSICGVNSDPKNPTPFTVSSRAPRPLGPYPHARRLGNLLFLSGFGPRHLATERIPEGMKAQTRLGIENAKAILEDAGSSLERVVDVTVFLTNIDRDFAAFNRA